MLTETIPKGHKDLDRSIDLGIDQFDRFLKNSWFWLLLLVLAMPLLATT